MIQVKHRIERLLSYAHHGGNTWSSNSESDRKTADAEDPALNLTRSAAGPDTRAGILTTLLLVQQTGLAVQAFPLPTPTTLMGEHSKPTRVPIGPRTIPSSPASRPAVAEVLYGSF